MHIPEGFVSSPVSATLAVMSVAAVGYAAMKFRRQATTDAMLWPLFALVSSFIFAAQMLNFPIGGGTSGHFLGAALAAALLGPWGACLALALVLSVQGVFFGDGGLSALGANIFVMGVVGGMAVAPLMNRLRSALPAGRAGELVSVGAAAWLSVVLASSACSVLLALSGTANLSAVLPAMLETHAVIGIGEALISVLAVWFATKAISATRSPSGTRKLGASGMALAVALAVFVSPFASAFPDGLERVAEDKGFISLASQTASPFADYQVAMIGNEALSTALAGLIGTLLVGAFSVGMARLSSRQAR